MKKSCKISKCRFKYKCNLTRHKKRMHHVFQDKSSKSKLKAELFYPNMHPLEIKKSNLQRVDGVLLNEIAKAKENIKQKFKTLKSGEKDIN